MKKFTKKREEELIQLTNDIAEDMPLKQWKRQDFVDCINYWRDALDGEIQKHDRTKLKVLDLQLSTL